MEISTARDTRIVDNAGMDLTSDIPLLLFFAANSCYALAYMLRNILALRLLSVTAALLTFPYFIFQTEVLYSALLWQTIFAGVNIVNIVRLLYERRSVKLTRQQRCFKKLVFSQFTDRQMLQILTSASAHSATKGQVLIDADREIDKVFLLCSGGVDIVQNGMHVTCRRPGTFLGEVHFMTGERTTATVTFRENSSYLSWEIEALRDLLSKNEQLCKAFDSLLTQDVAKKLRFGNESSQARPRGGLVVQSYS